MVIVSILCIGLSTATEQSLGTFKQNQCVILKQTCANCTYVNITSVVAKNSNGASVQLLGNAQMTKSGTEYNYTFCSTVNLGEYIYNTVGDVDGVATVQPISFTITPSGASSPLGLFIIVIASIYAVGFIGFFGKHVWVSALGGLALVALGLYTINNGIDMYRTFITEVFSWITIGLGALFVFIPLLEFVQDNY